MVLKTTFQKHLRICVSTTSHHTYWVNDTIHVSIIYLPKTRQNRLLSIVFSINSNLFNSSTRRRRRRVPTTHIRMQNEPSYQKFMIHLLTFIHQFSLHFAPFKCSFLIVQNLNIFSS